MGISVSSGIQIMSRLKKYSSLLNSYNAKTILSSNFKPCFAVQLALCLSTYVITKDELGEARHNYSFPCHNL